MEVAAQVDGWRHVLNENESVALSRLVVGTCSRDQRTGQRDGWVSAMSELPRRGNTFGPISSRGREILRHFPSEPARFGCGILFHQLPQTSATPSATLRSRELELDVVRAPSLPVTGQRASRFACDLSSFAFACAFMHSCIWFCLSSTMRRSHID